MKILLLVKDMPHNEVAVSYGGLIARVSQSSVTLLHVAVTEGDRPAGEQILDAARMLLPDMAVDTRLRRGDSAKKILREIQEGDYDLVIIGSRHHAGPMQHALGSVARAIFSYATTSVLIVGQARPGLNRILTCTGGVKASERVIEKSAQLASAANARLTLLHVTNPIPSMYTGLTSVEETLTDLLKTDTPIARHLRQGAEIVAGYGVEAELQLRHGVVVEEILREARMGDYDLIAIGVSGPSKKLVEWLLGDMAQKIVYHAPSPVLVVR